MGGEQILATVKCSLSIDEFSLPLVEDGLRDGQCILVVGGVDLKEKLSSLNRRIVVHGEIHNRTGHPWSYLDNVGAHMGVSGPRIGVIFRVKKPRQNPGEGRARSPSRGTR